MAARTRPQATATKEADEAEEAKLYGYDEVAAPTYYGPMPMYKSYGGATTFSELDQWQEASDMEREVSELFWQFRGLFENVMCDESLTPTQKADRVATATNEFQSRLTEAGAKEAAKEAAQAAAEDVANRTRDLPGEKAGRRMNRTMKERVQDAIKLLTGVGKWAEYDELDDEDDDEDEKAIRNLDVLDDGTGFKVFDTKDGPRWVTFSSNAYQDRDEEIFATKALEDAVVAADNEEVERGPLRLFHVKGADIGDADFQAVEGRFLIESGTFRDDDLGAAALKYFREHADEDFQISIGFKYKKGDEKDGVFDWVRILERSVLPAGTAANPWTSFALTEDGEQGETEMDDRKKNFLNDVLGEKRAAAIIDKADTDTKSLDEKVAYKESTDDAMKSVKSDLKTAIDATSDPKEKARLRKALAKYLDDEDDGGKKDDGDDNTGDADVGQTGVTLEDLRDVLTPIATAVGELRSAVSDLTGVKSTVDSLAEQVKSLTDGKAAADKEAGERATNTPRAAAAVTARTQGRELAAESVKELLGDESDDGKNPQPTNPINPFVQQLLRGVPEAVD